MNILFFLTPKSEVAYITEDFTINKGWEICGNNNRRRSTLDIKRFGREK